MISFEWKNSSILYYIFVTFSLRELKIYLHLKLAYKVVSKSKLEIMRLINITLDQNYNIINY